MAVDPEVADIVAKAARVFERDLGCIVEEVNPGWENPAAAFAAVMIGETDLRGMREMIAKYGNQMSSHMVDLMSHPWTAEELTTGNIQRKAVVNKMARMMSRYDLLITPTLAVAAFPVHMQGPEKIAGRYVRPESFLGFTYPTQLHRPTCSIGACRLHQRRLAGRPADRRASSRRRDGLARLRRLRGRAAVGSSMATAR